MCVCVTTNQVSEQDDCLHLSHPPGCDGRGCSTLVQPRLPFRFGEHFLFYRSWCAQGGRRPGEWGEPPDSSSDCVQCHFPAAHRPPAGQGIQVGKGSSVDLCIQINVDFIFCIVLNRVCYGDFALPYFLPDVSV